MASDTPQFRDSTDSSAVVFINEPAAILLFFAKVTIQGGQGKAFGLTHIVKPVWQNKLPRQTTLG